MRDRQNARVSLSVPGRSSLRRSVLVLAGLPVLASATLAQPQFDELRKRHLPANNDYTFAVALGDVDGDGDPDLVFGNSSFYNAQNRLYLNDGSGTFTDATAARMPTDNDYTFAVALGDVDGDGDPDLVFGNFNEQNRLYLNDGSGTFTAATAARMPTDNDGTAAVAVGDVDGDGDPDLVFGNGGLYKLQNRLYLNDGGGTFTDVTAARLPPDNDDTNAVAVGDVDGDGDLDLVFGNSGQQNRLYLNDGTPVRLLAAGEVAGQEELVLVGREAQHQVVRSQALSHWKNRPGQ